MATKDELRAKLHIPAGRLDAINDLLLDPDARVAEIGVAAQQLVEIARALCSPTRNTSSSTAGRPSKRAPWSAATIIRDR